MRTYITFVHCHKTNGLVERFVNKHTLLHAVAMLHSARCLLQIPKIAVSSAAIFQFSSGYSKVALGCLHAPQFMFYIYM
jgi:hypothetical protein